MPRFRPANRLASPPAEVGCAERDERGRSPWRLAGGSALPTFMPASPQEKHLYCRSWLCPDFSASCRCDIYEVQSAGSRSGSIYFCRLDWGAGCRWPASPWTQCQGDNCRWRRVALIRRGPCSAVHHGDGLPTRLSRNNHRDVSPDVPRHAGGILPVLLQWMPRRCLCSQLLGAGSVHTLRIATESFFRKLLTENVVRRTVFKTRYLVPQNGIKILQSAVSGACGAHLFNGGHHVQHHTHFL